jgi:hypothetical protein
MPRPAKRQKRVRVTPDTDSPSDDHDESKAKLNSPDATKPTTAPKRPHDGGFNALKTFKGQVYSGMAVGGSHTWNYDSVSLEPPSEFTSGRPC